MTNVSLSGFLSYEPELPTPGSVAGGRAAARSEEATEVVGEHACAWSCMVCWAGKVAVI